MGVRIGLPNGGPFRELTLEFNRVLPADTTRVFRAFSSEDELTKWWGPEGFTIPSVEFDPRVGDHYRIEMQAPEGDAFLLIGEFREVDRPARLSYTFVWEDPDPDDVENLVELSFQDLGESTEDRPHPGPFKTEARRELHRHGWTGQLSRSPECSSPAGIAGRATDSRALSIYPDAGLPRPRGAQFESGRRLSVLRRFWCPGLARSFPASGRVPRARCRDLLIAGPKPSSTSAW